MIKKARFTISIQVDIMFSVNRRRIVPALDVVLPCFCPMVKLTCVEHCNIDECLESRAQI